MTNLTRIRAAVAACAVLALSLAAGPPAQASITTFTASAYTAPAGTPIVLVAGSDASQAGATVSFSANGTQLAVVPVASGQAVLSWTPVYAGRYAVTASDGGSTASLTVTATTASTATVLSAPSSAQVGSPMTMTVTVTTASPSALRPAGTATVYLADGTPVGSAALSPVANPGQSVALVTWTPTQAGSVGLYAAYAPQAGTAAAASQSPVDTVLASASGAAISLVMPPTVALGVTVPMVAQAASGVTGTVAFSVSGVAIGGPVPISNGVATAPWTPTAAGPVTIQALLLGSPQGGVATETVTVQGSTNPDTITITSLAGTPWQQTTALLMLNGQSVTGRASSLSGAPVSLQVAYGQCAISGLTLTAQSGAGTCLITASTPGGSGYGPVTQGYTVQLSPGNQVLKVVPRKSGTLRRGTMVMLEGSGGSDTSAGQNARWKVTSGSRACALEVATDGAVWVRGVRNGSCTVVGTAPAVPGQWNALSVSRTYRVR